MPDTERSEGARSEASVPEPAATTGEAETRRSVLVRDDGFNEDDWSEAYVPWSGTDGIPALGHRFALDIESSALAEEIAPFFERVALIRIVFHSHMDGRGFSLARHLRLLGYRSRLRASGHLLADQYAMARRSGFDEVEIDAGLAARQPEDQWLFRANWRENNYQERLRRHLPEGSSGPQP